MGYGLLGEVWDRFLLEQFADAAAFDFRMLAYFKLYKGEELPYQIS